MAENKGIAQRKLSFAEDDVPFDIQKRTSYATSMANSERRQSNWNTGGGIKRRNSIVGRRLSNSYESRKSSSQDAIYHKVKLQNTYKTEPDEGEHFQPFKLESRIYDIFENSLKDKNYDARKCPELVKELTQEISREAHCVISRRYKLVIHVVIGEMKGQDIRCGSRCLWDTNFDNMASAYYKNSSLYAAGTVFAIYYE